MVRNSVRVSANLAPGVLLAVIVGLGTAMTIGVAVKQAPAHSPRAVQNDRVDSLLTAAGDARVKLGFPAGVHQRHQVVDPGDGSGPLDEIQETDAKGRVVSLTRFCGGRLCGAVRFDRPPKGASRIDASAASARAKGVLGSLALNAGEATETLGTDGGWTVKSIRTEKGIPVRGDGSTVREWPDGQIWMLAQSRHSLVGKSTAVVTRDTAVKVAMRQITNGSAATSHAQLKEASLMWVRPNGAYDPGRVPFEDAECRLAWVVNVELTQSDGETVSLYSVFVGAGDGRVIGGDLAE